ncbi:unnamed protein product [Polarella glacialis]|uniref:Uncharacterized protein n=1 Tax=Polarella glacialis TaxID=89957 RepID=A0A813HPS3_POLGL|nr:unnamed protein product [Polarella glacialis]
MSDHPDAVFFQSQRKEQVAGFEPFLDKRDGHSVNETAPQLERRRSVNFALKAKTLHFLPEPDGFYGVIVGIAAQLAACLTYVVMNANLPIVRMLSKASGSNTDYYDYSVGSVLLVTTMSNIVLGLVLTKAGGGRVSSCFEVRPMLESSHLSILSAVLVVLKFQVLVYLTATLATMLEQFKLITLAAAGFAVFGTRYSSIQILALFSLMLAMVQYALLSSEQAGSGINIKLGLLLQSAFVLISTLSTILREFKFKGGSTGVVEDFSVQQFRIAVPGLLVVMAYYAIESYVLQELQWTVGSNTQIFHGWDWATIRVIIVMLACDWLSNYIQKQLDSVVVQVLGCVTIALVYVEQHLLYPDKPISLNDCIALVMVIILASSFAMSTRFTNQYKKLECELANHIQRHPSN